jgi:hypothetical protein
VRHRLARTAAAAGRDRRWPKVGSWTPARWDERIKELTFEIDFVLDETEPPISRRVSSPSRLSPGVEIPFDDGVWRVIRITGGEHGADQTVICRLVEGDD